MTITEFALDIIGEDTMTYGIDKDLNDVDWYACRRTKKNLQLIFKVKTSKLDSAIKYRIKKITQAGYSAKLA